LTCTANAKQFSFAKMKKLTGKLEKLAVDVIQFAHTSMAEPT